MHRYIPGTEGDTKKMLDLLGLEKLSSLFEDIPQDLQLGRPLGLAAGMTEPEIRRKIEELADKNIGTDKLVCFLGAGVYDHYIPSIINHLAKRSEFYTAYTPYQPEISQGTLQAIFEYQTMICNLTGMDVSNASLYDGATAAAEGAIMATVQTGRKKILVSETFHPETRKVLKTYMHYRDLDLVEIPMADGVTDVESLKSLIDNDTACVLIQNPNFFGIIEDPGEIEKISHDNKSLLLVSADPISLAILKKPGDYGADIVVGEGQPLGNSMSFGGPYLGFMAVRSKFMRKMPGRIVGQSLDLDGRRAYVLTIQAREQHIRRYKATSNICSNQNLNALIASIYMVTLGKEGLKEVARQCVEKSYYLKDKLVAGGRYRLAFDKPFFREFAIIGETPGHEISRKLLDEGILGGYDLTSDYKIENGLLLAVTEKRTKSEMDKLAALMEVI